MISTRGLQFQWPKWTYNNNQPYVVVIAGLFHKKHMENISPQRIPNTPCASLRPTHFSTAAAEFHLNGCGFAELGILNFLQDLLRKPSRLARIFRIASPAHLYEWYVGVKTNINIIYYITSINRLYIVSITIYIYTYILVGGFNPSEKYESQLGWWNSQYMEQ